MLFAQKAPLIQMSFDQNLSINSRSNFNVKSFGAIDYSTDRFGVPCKALAFYGKSYVEIEHHDDINKIQDNFTFAVWFMINSTNSSDYWLSFICKGDELEERSDNPHFRVQAFLGQNISTVSICTDFTEYDQGNRQQNFQPDVWYHYILRYDGSKIQTYINGNLTWEFAYSNKLWENKSSIFIGKDIPGEIEYFNGHLDDLLLYDYAYPENRIWELVHMKSYHPRNYSVSYEKVIKVNNDPGKCGAKVEYFSPMSFCDGLDSFRLIKGLSSGSFFPIDQTQNVFEVKRGENRTICQNTINVIDNEPPRISNINDTIISIQDSFWQYTDFKVKVSDNCSIKELRRIDTNASTQFYKPGEYNVGYFAKDINDNETKYYFKLTIQSINITEEKDQDIKKLSGNKTSLPTVKVPIPDKIVLKAEYAFSSNNVTMVIYDNRTQDGDRISVYYNGKRIIKDKTIKNKHRGMLIHTLLIDESINNYIVIQAHNMGTVGRNTVKVEFYDGINVDLSEKCDYSKQYSSKPGFASAILLKSKK